MTTIDGLRRSARHAGGCALAAVLLGMGIAAQAACPNPNPNPNATLRVANDFNGDCRSDILWRNSVTGEDAIWQMDGLTLASGALIPTVTDTLWAMVASGDFDGDGKADILWRNLGSGDNAIWMMNGFNPSSSALIPAVSAPGWTVVATGDFNGDGRSDILWRNIDTGDNAIWLMDGFTAATTALIPAVSTPGWTIVGVGDFDGDSRSDILWRNNLSGDNAVWLMNGINPAGAALIAAVSASDWAVFGVGDFDGNGKSDILWRNTGSGQNAIWLMDGLSLAGSALIPGVAGTDWMIAGVGDHDGDARADILWRNAGTGDNAIWLMNGFNVAGSALIAAAPGSWALPLSPGLPDTFDAVRVACDAAIPSNASDPKLYARAMDLCQATTEIPPTQQRRWGLISAQFQLPDGTSTPAATSRSIRAGFGSGGAARFGAALAVLSTGNAATQGQTNPAYVAFQPGRVVGTQSAFPADWYAANGNALPQATGCPAPNGAVANDPIMLRLRIRVPGNARSFRVAARFFSAEYPEYVCSPYNDFFVALLDSRFAGSPANPTDKNIALYSSGGGTYPIGVNLSHGNTGLFQTCKNGPTGCATGAVLGNTTACTSTSELAGTGFDLVNPPPVFPGEPGYCSANNLLGGGTAWLTVRGNVVPGETIELRFALWDTSDGYLDSLVLLDDFQWSTETIVPGAFPGD